MTLTEFLLARIAEDEAIARAASGATVVGVTSSWSPVSSGDEWAVAQSDDPDEILEMLVGLRPGLPLPPDPLSGYWGVRATWRREDSYDRASDNLGPAVHMARWDPARVLAECEAKRQAVQTLVGWAPDPVGDSRVETSEHDAWRMLCMLALPYASHPDYQPEWAA